MMEADEIHTLISDALPGSRVRIDDLRADGNHYVVTVEYAGFAGVPIVDQHRMVFAALEGRMGGILRAMTLTTLVPKGRGG